MSWFVLPREQVKHLVKLLIQSDGNGPVTFYVDEEGIDVAWGQILRGGKFGNSGKMPTDNPTSKWVEEVIAKPSGNPYANVPQDDIVQALGKLTEAVNRLNPQRMATNHHYQNYNR